jgi:phosphoribosylformylglycinamidine (FGAM) synthase-like amidotransferase family enzyme
MKNFQKTSNRYLIPESRKVSRKESKQFECAKVYHSYRKLRKLYIRKFGYKYEHNVTITHGYSKELIKILRAVLMRDILLNRYEPFLEIRISKG